MAFMPWSDSYAVGVTWVDNQHKKLVGLINALHDVIREGAKQDYMQAVLEDLLAYADSHFADEERAMERAGFDGLALHRRKHQSMRAEVEKLKRLSSESHTFNPAMLMEFLKGWLSKHIGETDRMYVPALKAAGLS